ncbi:Na+/H+ antiporter subunit E [Pseudomonas stutzeri]|nr:Na+/H+ antiporter subunit E [Stutzerimonas stutzeri]
MLDRVLPYPFLSIGLLLVWPLLVNDFSLGHWLLGGLLALAIPQVVRDPRNRPWRIRHPLKLLRYVLRLFGDIARANLDVARLVLGPVERLQPAFVEVPIELEHELAIFLLASSISLAPGTVAASLSVDRRRLLVHALHSGDDQALIAEIKSRYEAPLKEIFAC